VEPGTKDEIVPYHKRPTRKGQNEQVKTACCPKHRLTRGKWWVHGKKERRKKRGLSTLHRENAKKASTTGERRGAKTLVALQGEFGPTQIRNPKGREEGGRTKHGAGTSTDPNF